MCESFHVFFFFNIFLCKSLRCELDPVHYQEYEYGLLKMQFWVKIVRKANEIDILMNTHVAHSLTQLLFWDCKLSPLKYALKSEFSKLDFKVYLSGGQCHIQQAVHYFHRCQ